MGDVLLATAFLSYSGPFNQEFRDVLLNCWKKEMRKNKIPFSEVSSSLLLSLSLVSKALFVCLFVYKVDFWDTSEYVDRINMQTVNYLIKLNLL